jgi:hypothetical protein
VNFAEHFDSKLASDSPVALDGERFSFDTAPGFAQQHSASGVVVVPDAHLLFSGDYMRIGYDLIISGAEGKFVVGNYFKGESRPTLASKDGATLSGHIVDALTGHVHYAQATAPAPAQAIGHVLKLTGSATVVRNGVSIDLHIGDAVQKGDVVQTGSDSTIGMTFIDGSAFAMTSNARMVLNEMIYDPNGSSNASLLSLVQGTITFVAGQTAKNGNMRVDTPVATMGIRGTAVLVEIGANDGPTKFSVLVEPDGHTGSYNLYDKGSGQLIGTVSQAGQVTFVSSLGVGQGVTAVEELKTLQDQQAEKAIIQQVFQLFFPNYNPDDSKPNTTKFGFSGGNNLAEIIIGTMTFGNQTVISQIELHFTLPDPESGLPPPPGIVFYNAKAAFSARDVFTKEAGATTVETIETFKIGDLVHIDDPDIGHAPFYDIGVPFVPGSAVIKSATVSLADLVPTLTEADLKALLHIDQATGQVSFDRKDFDFLAVGQKVEYVIQATASSGPDSAQVLIRVTIDGENDAPELNVAHAITEGIEFRGLKPLHTFTLHDLQISDVDDDHGVGNYKLEVTSDHGSLSLAGGADGLSVSSQNGGKTLTVEGSLDKLNAALTGDLNGLKYTTGLLDSKVEHVKVEITDNHGLTDTRTFVFQQNDLASGALTGTDGKDVIFSNLGSNVMTGGAGADTFVFDGLKGFDIITDFHQGEDRILISSAFSDFNDLLAHTFDFNGNAVIVSGLATLTIAGIDKQHLTSSDFHIVA